MRKLGGKVPFLADDELTLFMSLMYLSLLTMVKVGETLAPKSSSKLTLSKPSIERSSKGSMPAKLDYVIIRHIRFYYSSHTKSKAQLVVKS